MSCPGGPTSGYVRKMRHEDDLLVEKEQKVKKQKLDGMQKPNEWKSELEEQDEKERLRPMFE
jgi:hypothetical protein